MDIGKAFGYVFEDEKWVTKILIGGLLLIIPIFGILVVLGYSLKVAENVMRNNPRPLPEWTDFGDLFMRGLYYFVIALVYQIPTIVLYCIVGLLFGGLSAAADSSSRGASNAAGGAALLVACLYPLIALLALVLAVAVYTATARYVATGTLSEAFKFSEVLGSLRANIGTWIVFILCAILASFVGSLGIIACGIGALFTYTYAYSVVGHLLGQTIQRTGLATSGNFVTDPVPPYTPPTTFQ